MIDNDNTAKVNQLKTMLNRIYGRAMMANVQLYVDTDSLLDIDCDFCRNTHTCEELDNDNDLSYRSCGTVDTGFRMMFRTGDNRPTQLIIEQLRITGLNYNALKWELVGAFTPNYCPFCGRPLIENMKQKENKNV